MSGQASHHNNYYPSYPSSSSNSNSNSNSNNSSVITLTGATLEPPQTKNYYSNNMSHDHHSHSHDHGAGGAGGACQHNHHGDMELTTTTTTPLSVEELLQGSRAELSTTITTLLRYGRFEALEPLLHGLQQTSDNTNNNSNTKLSELLMAHDDQGHSLFHWAAKRGDDLRFLSTLLDLAIHYHPTMDIVLQPRYVIFCICCLSMGWFFIW